MAFFALRPGKGTKKGNNSTGIIFAPAIKVTLLKHEQRDQASHQKKLLTLRVKYKAELHICIENYN